MNILLGFLCFVVINNTYPRVQVPVISEIIPDSAAEEAGLMVGDEIVKLNNTHVATQSDVALFMMDNALDEVTVTYIRQGEKHKATVYPVEQLIGFKSSIKELSFWETVEYSFYDTRYVVKAVMVSIKMMLTGEAKVSDMSGPVGVVQVVGDAAESASPYGLLAVVMQLLMLFAMISVNLGVFNLLPFPGLDGGSIIFAFIELITRKKLKPEVLGVINLAGLVLLLGLGIFIMFSDITKLL